jgi:sugar phosphate isomerase/epimerase
MANNPDSSGKMKKIDEVFGGKKLVYSTTNFLKYPLEQALRRIADGGFHNVEIWGNVKHLDPRNENEDTGSTAKLCRELGLDVVSLHAPFTLDHDDDSGRRMSDWEKLVVRSMEQAEILGANTIVVHPVVSGTDNSDEAYRAMVDRTGGSLLRLAHEAAKRGQRVAIENMPAHRVRRWGRDVGGELFEFVTSSGMENLGLCLDTGHVVFNNGDPVVDLELCAERVFSVHMNDNIWGMHMDLHLVPGTGSVDWQRFRQLLRSDRFGGMIVLELDGRGRPSSIFEEACTFTTNYFYGDDGA